MIQKIFFLVFALGSLSPLVSAPIALFLGIVLAMLFDRSLPGWLKTAAKIVLQISVVGLGFGMNLQHVIQTGAQGLFYTAGGIGFSIAVGLFLGRALHVPGVTAYLISIGTAICGGSAIAAIGPIVAASAGAMAVSLGTVFVLNSLALVIFPMIGEMLGLTQQQFGLWAALAIHDTSSVVAATARYGPQALALGTTIKLARALWIVPVSLATAFFQRSQASMQWPWFILFFILAAAINTYVPGPQGIYAYLVAAAKAGFKLTLFLIGSSISRTVLRDVGWRPFLQGLLLWLGVSVIALILVLRETIG